MSDNPSETEILVVEDDALAAADLASRLNGLGYKALGQAASGEEAVERAERHRPDVVMMDIVLQGAMDGIDAARAIREKNGAAVVFLVAPGEEKRLEEAGLAWPYGYLFKPIGENQIGIAVTAALNAAKSEAENRQAQEGLNENKAFLNYVMDTVQSSITITRVGDGRFIYVNDAFCQDTGFSRDDALGRTPFEINLLADPSVRETFIGILKETGQIPGFEVDYRCKDGSIIKTQLFARPLLFQGEECLLALQKFVVKRQEIELELKKSEERYKLAMEGAQDGLWDWDLEKDEVYLSPNMPRIADLEEFSAPSGSEGLFRFVHPDDREPFAAILKSHFKGQTEYCIFEHRLNTGDDREVWVHNRWVGLRGDNGRVYRVIGSLRNITDRKRAEEEKTKLQVQLQHAQKMEAVGILAGGISHDFNNLLQAITGYIQLLLKDKDESQKDYARLVGIERASDRAIRLVQQLLVFSRKAETERRPLNLKREIEQSGRLLERTIPKMIDIRFQLDDRLKAVMADPVQMEMVLLNLGKNASDSMPQGGRLTISAGNVTIDEESALDLPGLVPGPYVRLTVSDTGKGMDGETLEHIFEPFFTTKDIGQGTGLGLASVYGVVKAHDGHITCHSEIGQGTVFAIYLPAVDREIAGESIEPEIQPPPRGSETVLFVDDEEQLLEIATEILTEFGYHVLTAASGEQALEIYQAQSDRIDLVILDIGMPGMGGFKCFREIMRFDPGAKVLIASGYAADGQIRESLESGAAGYVAKPYRVHGLINEVRSVLDGRH